jgi:DNA repair protein RecO (recombination protein O)
MATPQLYKTTGIILKRTNSGEGDKIITALCEHQGKKRLVGKGIRKINSRRSGHIELFSKTNFLIHSGKTLDYITGATAIDVYGASYRLLSQVAAAYTACEVIDRLIMEGQEHDEAFYRLDKFLSDVKTTSPEQVPTILKEFIDDMLKILGYKTVDSRSTSLGNAVASVERIIERKVRSINLFSKSGIDVFEKK